MTFLLLEIVPCQSYTRSGAADKCWTHIINIIVLLRMHQRGDILGGKRNASYMRANGLIVCTSVYAQGNVLSVGVTRDRR